MFKDNNIKVQGGHFVNKQDTDPRQVADDEVLIHVMPKRFLNAVEASPHKAKGAGILILLGGALVLVALAVFIYFYFFTNSLKPAVPIVEPNQVKKEESKQNEVKVPEVKKQESQGEKETEKTAGGPESASTTDNKISLDGNGSVELEQNIIDSNQTASSTIASTTKEVENKIITVQNPIDTDRDGLFDSEETIFGTNPNMSDSDGDNFPDLSEVIGLYNPATAGAILTNKGIEKYENNTYGYSMYYPSSWRVSSVGDDSSIIVKTENNQFIQIMVNQNTQSQTIDEWYNSNISNNRIPSSQRIYKNGWTGIRSEDGLIIYLLSKNNLIFTLNYNLGVESIVYYKNILSMMVNSLEIKNK